MPRMSVAICEILDRLGSPNPFSDTSPFELKFSGPETVESIALESCLRNIVHRYQELERKVIEERPETGVNGTVQRGQASDDSSPAAGYSVDRTFCSILIVGPGFS